MAGKSSIKIWLPGPRRFQLLSSGITAALPNDRLRPHSGHYCPSQTGPPKSRPFHEIEEVTLLQEHFELAYAVSTELFVLEVIRKTSRSRHPPQLAVWITTLGICYHLVVGAQAEMKLISCTVWILGAVMVIASVDAVPDPPAVTPHTVNVTSRQCEIRGGFCEPRLDCNSPCISRLQVRWIAFTRPYEPNRPSDWVALTGHAADTSPPAA